MTTPLWQRYADQRLQDFEVERKKYIKDLAAYREHLPDLPEPSYISISSLNGFWLSYPYDRNLREQIRQTLLSNGWTISTERSEADIVKPSDQPLIILHYDHQIYLVLEFSASRSGSTCKRVEIGTKIQEVPVYDFICEEASNV